MREETGRHGASRAVFGMAGRPVEVLRIGSGALTTEISEGALLRVCFGGVEVVRGIDCLVRDADWGTAPRRVLSEETREDGYVCRFEAGAFSGDLQVVLKHGRLTAAATLTAGEDCLVNRAGFILLHPLRGVAGEALEVSHPDGSATRTRFPQRISPGQPALDIARLAYAVEGVSVRIAFEGEVFEMEDQRNWTDASFKTYCRPLSAPRPFRVAAGETLRQVITVEASGTPSRADAPPEARTGVMPQIDCALEAGMSLAAVGRIPFSALLLRMRAGDPLPGGLPDLPLALELVVDGPGGLEVTAAALRAAGVSPLRVIALPEAYLASHQPQGPWPGGTTPAEATAAARQAFPDAEVGAGMLTNFTELNRCPPFHSSDFVTFGTTALVHDAADRAVMQTLEALGDVLVSARAVAGDRPVRLGLGAIGMRGNPYGAAVAPNPGQVRLAMAEDDPRQRGLFAAAFAVGYAAQAAMARVASWAPAMAEGPLGLGSPDRVVPLFHVVRALAGMAGARLAVSGDIPGGLVTLTTAQGAGLAANLSGAAVTLDGGWRRLGVAEAVAAGAPSWLDTKPAGGSGPVVLAPYEIAFATGGRA